MTALDIIRKPGRENQVIPLSVEAYHALGEIGLLPEKTELLDGFVFHQMPKSPLHRYLVLCLYEMARSHRPSGTTVFLEQPLTLGNSEPEPDISVIPGTNLDYSNTHPTTALFVLEVSITSETLDRDKARIYASAGIPEYWLVNAAEQKIEIFRDPTPTGYTLTQVVSAGETITSSSIPGFTVEVGPLFQRPPA